MMAPGIKFLRALNASLNRSWRLRRIFVLRLQRVRLDIARATNECLVVCRKLLYLMILWFCESGK